MSARWTTWEEVSARAGRNDMPAILANNWSRLSRTERAKGLHEAWVLAEWPEQYLAFAPGQLKSYPEGLGGWYLWTKMFRNVCREERDYLHNDDVRPMTELPEWITLYRGAIEDLQGGMSWTDDEGLARWFASRFNGMYTQKYEPQNGHLYRLEAQREFVLAKFDIRRNESQYVLDLGNVDAMAIDDLGEVVRETEKKEDTNE